MLYTEITIGGNDYKLRLDARNCVAVEKKIGKNPLAILFAMNNGELPKVGEVIAILQGSLQKYHKDINEEKTFDLYEQMLAEGKDYTSIIGLITEVFQCSGLVPKIADESVEIKN